jgi:hypothetical protein
MEDVLVQMLEKIAKHFDISLENTTRQSLLNSIQKEDEKMHTLCYEFLLAWDAWTFSRKDMHLNLKAPDLFKIQKQMFLENLNNKGNELLVETLKIDVDIKPFLKTLEIEF